MILNRAELVNNAPDRSTGHARRLLVSALEFALASADPHRLVSHFVKKRGNRLLVGKEAIPLDGCDRIFVVGAGKASGAMAEALEGILGDRLQGGIISVPTKESAPKLSHVRLIEASHPIPDQNSMRAAEEIIALCRNLTDRDLLICAISGGGSALLSLPVKPLTLEEKSATMRTIMNAGSTIVELNTVRKHLSSVKGGWLAKHCAAGRVIGLVVSDVAGDRLDSIASGPISPDPTTFQDAIGVLDKYALWDSIPGSVRRILRDGAGGRIPETPKENDPCFQKVRTYITGSNRIACTAMQRYLRSRGLNVKILSTSVTGEARSLGAFIGSLAREISTFNEPFRKPCAFILGGETTVRVTGSGLGGRNQECAMGCAAEIQGLKAVAMASIGTDGIDGPTDAAGAIVDGMTIPRSQVLGLRFEQMLSNNDSYRFFSPLKDLVMTGRTHTNVNDLAAAVLL